MSILSPISLAYVQTIPVDVVTYVIPEVLGKSWQINAMSYGIGYLIENSPDAINYFPSE